MADYVCINRSYLYTLFQNSLGMSPQQFLMTFRITKATELLQLTSLSIELATPYVLCSIISRTAWYNSSERSEPIMEKAYKLEFAGEKSGSLYVNCCGCSKTEPLHSFGPALKPHYIIHYILSGNSIRNSSSAPFSAAMPGSKPDRTAKAIPAPSPAIMCWNVALPCVFWSALQLL